MPLNRMAIRRIIACVLFIGALGVGVGGCARPAVGTGPDAEKPQAGDADVSATAPNQAELWAQNCGRCHNLRPPSEFSGAQWDAIVHHMSVRANLTGADSRAILEFLKAAKAAPPAIVGQGN